MKTIELTKEEIKSLLNGDTIELDSGAKRGTRSELSKGLGEPVMFKIKKKAEQWEPKFGEFTLSFNMQPVFVKDHVKSQENLKSLKESGMLMGTYKQAERAAKKMRAFNRLLAYVDEFDPDYEWQYGEDNYYVYCGDEEQLHYVAFTKYTKGINTVYMSEEVAEELCRKLNSGEVVL